MVLASSSGWARARRVVFAAGAPLLSSGLIASAALNVWQLKAASDLRMDPYELAMYEGWPAPPAPAAGARRLVLYGDSRARSWEEPSIEGFQVINRGIGYQTTAQVRGRVDQDLIPLRPDLVVVQAGINDLKALRFGARERDRVIQRCVDNLVALVRRLPEARFVVMTIFSVGHLPLLFDALWPIEPTVGTVREANARLRRGLPGGTTLFESGAVLEQEDGTIASEFTRGTLHINERGYAALLAALRPVLARIPSPP